MNFISFNIQIYIYIHKLRKKKKIFKKKNILNSMDIFAKSSCCPRFRSENLTYM